MTSDKSTKAINLFLSMKIAVVIIIKQVQRNKRP